MTDESLVYVGCDDGYAAIKLAWIDGNDGVIRTLNFPSSIAAGNKYSSLNGETSDFVYETNGRVFTVCPPGGGEDTRFADYAVSDFNRVLVWHALRTAELSGRTLSLVTGVPVGEFFRSAAGINEKLRAEKTASIKKPVRSVKVNSPPPKLLFNDICPEGIAAVMDSLVDAHGNLTGTIEGMWGVVDVGGRTTDVATVMCNPTITIARDSTGSADIGVLKARDLLAQRIADEFDVQPDDIAQLDNALETGKVRLWGRTQDISRHIPPVIQEVGDEILRFVARKLGNGAKLDRILFVGGGAALFKEVLSGYPSAEIPNDPELANARGMCKHARLIASGG